MAVPANLKSMGLGKALAYLEEYHDEWAKAEDVLKEDRDTVRKSEVRVRNARNNLDELKRAINEHWPEVMPPAPKVEDHAEDCMDDGCEGC